MRMSAIGRAALMAREGCELDAYPDTVGVWTIGTGHASTCGRAPIPRKGMRITQAQADAILIDDLAHIEAAIGAAIKVPVAEHEADAILSLAFNAGEHAIAKSTLVRKLNAGDRHGAALQFLEWRKPISLLPRRKAEALQFTTPYATELPRRAIGEKPIKAPGTAPAAPAANDNAPRGFLAKLAASFTRA